MARVEFQLKSWIKCRNPRTLIATTLDSTLHMPKYSHMPKYRSFNVDKLFDEVKEAWYSYPSQKLHDIFDTKHAIMEEIILAKGDNNYSQYRKLPV